MLYLRNSMSIIFPAKRILSKFTKIFSEVKQQFSKDSFNFSLLRHENIKITSNFQPTWHVI